MTTRQPGLTDAFAGSVSAHPSRIALRWSGGSWTYSELDDRVDRYVQGLRRVGVVPRAVVGVRIERGPELVAALLAVARAGAAYLPVDPDWPRRRVEFILRDCGCAVVLTDGPSGGPEPSVGRAAARWIVLDDLCAGLSPRPAAQRTEPIPEPTDLVYVLYTSGSTGRPKGVGVEHRNLAHYLAWCREAYTPGRPASSLLFTALTFDLTVTALWTPLVTGGELHLAPPSPGLPGLAALRAVSLVKITPAHVRALAADLGAHPVLANQGETEQGDSGQVIVVGGEELRVEDVTRARRLFPRARLVNEYGPTETTVGCAVWEVGDVAGRARIPIGRAIRGTTISIVSPDLDAVPPGVVGEICIGGAGVARGYVGDPVRTAERFLPDPDDPAGGQCYLTGDLGRRWTDGVLEFLGRRDDQVKVDGYRIELGEIEAAVAACPAVRDCAVVLEAGTAYSPRLAAYLVGRDGDADPAPQVRAWLAEVLPGYMVPRRIRAVRELPTTSHGKIDRRALAPLADEPVRYRAPGTAAERTLAQVWSDVLGRHRIGADDDFFALGGDSLAAMSVVGRARRQGIVLTAQDIVAHPTVAALGRLSAQRAAREAGDGIAPTAVPVSVLGPTRGIPLTPIQRDFFEVDPVHVDIFQQYVLLEPPTPLDISALRVALGSLGGAHESLRLRFMQEGGKWIQYVTADGPGFALELHDLSGLGTDRHTAAAHRATALAKQKFDLSGGHVARAALLTLGPDEHCLLLAAHHLVVDIVSWRVLLDDLEAAYALVLGGGAPAVPEPEAVSFTHWARQLADPPGGLGPAGLGLEAEASYWASAVISEDKAAPCPLPADDESGPNDWQHADSIRLRLPGWLPSGELPRLGALPPRDTIIAALVHALCEPDGRRELRIDIEGHGRDPSLGLDVSRTTGWFTALFPVHVALPPGADPAAALSAASSALSGVPRGGLGFAVLRGLGALSTPAARAQVCFNYRGVTHPEAPGRLFRRLPGLGIPAVDPRRTRSHEIEVESGFEGADLDLEVRYSRGRHRRETVEALVARIEAALRKLREVIA